MVRKWSYLKTFDLVTPSTLLPIKTVKSFKVFRKTTRFKKYNRGITKIVRRKYMTRKRKSTSLFAYYITKDWVYHYLKLRQFERFYQSFGLSNITAYAADFDVFKVATERINEGGIHIFSTTKSLFTFFQEKKLSLNSVLKQSRIKDSKQTFVQTNSFETLSNSTFSYPIAANLNNSDYHIMSTPLTTPQNTQLLKTLQLTQLNFTLKYIHVYNKLLVLLSLKTLFHKK